MSAHDDYIKHITCAVAQRIYCDPDLSQPIADLRKDHDLTPATMQAYLDAREDLLALNIDLYVVDLQQLCEIFDPPN